MTRECRRSDFNRCRSTCFLPLRSSSSIFFLSYILLSPLFLPIKTRLVSFPLDLARPASFPFHSNYIYIVRREYIKIKILFSRFILLYLFFHSRTEEYSCEPSYSIKIDFLRTRATEFNHRKGGGFYLDLRLSLFETESNINPGSSMCNSIILSKNLDSLYIHGKDVSSPYNNPRKDNTAVRFPKIRFLSD